MFALKYEQKENLKFTLDSPDDDKWTVLALKEFGRQEWQNPASQL